MTESELARIEALCEAATPGPWFVYAGAVAIEIDNRNYDPDTGREIGECYPEKVAEAGDDDMLFIATARTAVPALIAEVRPLRAELAEANAMLDWLEVNYGDAPTHIPTTRAAIKTAMFHGDITDRCKAIGAKVDAITAAMEETP